MRIFISYRRDDCYLQANSIYFRLDQSTDTEIFFDVDTIAPGENFVDAMKREIDRADVFLALIGDDWLSLKDPDGQPRIAKPTDHVHTEISLALERGIPIVPVLVEDAEMPSAHELPEPLRELALRNAFHVRNASLTSDVNRLAEFMSQMTSAEPRPIAPDSRDVAIDARVLDDSDEVGEAALAAARAMVEREPMLVGEGQRVLERGLAEALAGALDGAQVERKWAVPGWDPQPGRFDVLVAGSDPRPRLAVETKLKDDSNMYESIWDAVKLLSLATLDHVDAVYIVAGSTQANWAKQFRGHELFEPGEHELIELIASVGDWWERYLLPEAAGRPLLAPGRLQVDLVAAIPFPVRGSSWELRAVKLTPLPGDWVEFDEGSPPRGTTDVAEPNASGEEPEPASDAGEADTVIVAARQAYPEYLQSSCYICPTHYSIREVERLGFYRDRAIQPEIPLILDRRESVAFTPTEAERLRAGGSASDRVVADVIERSLAGTTPNERNEVERYKVFLLSGPDDERTIRIKPILHQGKSAWTMGRRYANSQSLITATTTVDLPKPNAREADAKPKLDFDLATRFIESVPAGRWTSYKEVAKAAGAPRGGMAVGQWLLKTGEEIAGVWRVLQTKGSVSPGWKARNPDLPPTPEAVREKLRQEGVLLDAEGRAHIGQIWRAEDWTAG